MSRVSIDISCRSIADIVADIQQIPQQDRHRMAICIADERVMLSKLRGMVNKKQVDANIEEVLDLLYGGVLRGITSVTDVLFLLLKQNVYVTPSYAMLLQDIWNVLYNDSPCYIDKYMYLLTEEGITVNNCSTKLNINTTSTNKKVYTPYKEVEFFFSNHSLHDYVSILEYIYNIKYVRY